MRKFMVYFDDGGEYCYKLAVSAENEQEAKDYVKGNGAIIAVHDITEDYPIDINKVVEALRKDHFGQVEINLIASVLSKTNIAN